MSNPRLPEGTDNQCSTWNPKVQTADEWQRELEDVIDTITHDTSGNVSEALMHADTETGKLLRRFLDRAFNRGKEMGAKPHQSILTSKQLAREAQCIGYMLIKNAYEYYAEQHDEDTQMVLTAILGDLDNE